MATESPGDQAEHQDMATDRQIEANRKNAARSTGPKTDEGKARSRANATTHGMAGASSDVEAGRSPEFLDRRAKWGAEQRPVGEAANYALDLAVAASLRIDRCERALDDLTAASRARALLAWDRDQAVEAATTFGRLAREPMLASCRLQASLAGVGLLIQAWLGLASALGDGEDWSTAQASMALDLLGVAVELRTGRTPIDDPDGGDPVAFHRDLAHEEIEWLESLRDDSLAPLDAMERAQAMTGDLALLSKPAKLVLRYERDACKRYDLSMRQIRAVAPDPAPQVDSEPVPVTVPRTVEPAAPRSKVGPRPAVAAPSFVAPSGFDDDSDWLDDLDGQIDALATARRGFEPPHRNEANFAVGRAVELAR